VKKGPFFEHSPTLYDISAVPYWGKINKGMVKMYKVEVLGKFPVIQHFPIGKVFFMLDEASSTTPMKCAPTERELIALQKQAASMGSTLNHPVLGGKFSSNDSMNQLMALDQEKRRHLQSQRMGPPL